MNRFELICNYCNHQWGINYRPTTIYCGKCKDSNVRVIDTAVEKVDYYGGSPKFEEKTTRDPDPDDYI